MGHHHLQRGSPGKPSGGFCCLRQQDPTFGSRGSDSGFPPLFISLGFPTHYKGSPQNPWSLGPLCVQSLSPFTLAEAILVLDHLWDDWVLLVFSDDLI